MKGPERTAGGPADRTANDPVEPHSFWGRATPRQGARALAELYGAAAAEQAASLAREAAAAGHDGDHRFWTAVYARLVTARGET